MKSGLDRTPVIHGGGVGAEQDWNEQALLETVREPMVRFWCHERPGVVLGASQRKMLPSVEGHAIEVVGRRAGGGAVLAGPWMLSTSVLLPVHHELAGGGTSRAYEWLGTQYSAILLELGIDARAASDPRGAGDLAWACFAGVTRWEVLVGQRKMVGLAQSRRQTGVLVVAGILMDVPDWGLLCNVMHRPAEESMALADCTRSLRQGLGNVPDPRSVAAALARRLMPRLVVESVPYAR